MKIKLLALLALLPITAFAQNFEIGLGGGLSINGAPTNNEVYRGDIITPNYAIQATILRNYVDNWQLGFDTHVLELSRKTDQLFSGPHKGEWIGGNGKKFIYGQISVSACAVVDKKFVIKHGYFYVGVGGGLGLVRNKHTFSPSDDVAYIAPDGSYGLVYGLQGGFNHDISKRFSFNAEIALRVFDMNNNARALDVSPVTDLHYRIVGYPLTVGIHYKFGGDKKQYMAYKTAVSE